MPGFVVKYFTHITINLILREELGSRHNYYPHFANVEIVRSFLILETWERLHVVYLKGLGTSPLGGKMEQCSSSRPSAHSFQSRAAPNFMGGGPSQGDQLLWFALDFPIFSTETHRSYLTPQFWVKLDSWSSYSKHCWFWRKVGRTYLEQVDGSPVLWSSRSLAGPSLWTISHEYLHKHSYINGKVQVAYFHFLKSHHGTPYKIGNIKKEKRPITRIAF